MSIRIFFFLNGFQKKLQGLRKHWPKEFLCENEKQLIVLR